MVNGPLMRVKQPQLLVKMGPQMLSRVKGTNDDDDEEEDTSSKVLGGISRGEGEGTRDVWVGAGMVSTESARNWVAMAPSVTRLQGMIEKTMMSDKIDKE